MLNNSKDILRLDLTRFAPFAKIFVTPFSLARQERITEDSMKLSTLKVMIKSFLSIVVEIQFKLGPI